MVSSMRWENTFSQAREFLQNTICIMSNPGLSSRNRQRARPRGLNIVGPNVLALFLAFVAVSALCLANASAMRAQESSLLENKERESSLNEHDTLVKAAFVNRLNRLQEPAYAYNLRHTLSRNLAVRLLLPTRVSTLSKAEEKVRAHLTWQMFDEKLHLAAFGPKEKLALEVFGAEEWFDFLDELVLEFEDEIPFWISIGRTKKVVTKEAYEKMQAVRCAKKYRQRAREAARHKDKQLRRAKNLKLKGKAVDSVGNDVVKGQLNSGNERLRITLVDRSIVEHYFARDGRRPVGKRLKMQVVFPGAWANMSNMEIAAPCNIIEEERLLIDGEERVRPAGSSSKGRLKKLCQIRAQEPELFTHAEVYQSPSSNRDEVTD